jgi:excisionase family DNA binding protein
MTVKQVADYLHLNEKKVYALANDGGIPATKVTGKWIFPRELIDRWLLESSHGGLLSDRLLLVGGDDPLLHRLLQINVRHDRARSLISSSPTGTRLGLELLDRGRADICVMHWGPAAESATRHPALLSQHASHRKWVLVRAFQREQGLLLSRRAAALDTLEALQASALRWATRGDGSGSQRLLREVLARRADQTEPFYEVNSEREAAALVSMGEVDIAPSSRAMANEYGLQFLPLDWVAVDFALPASIYFRQMFQALLNTLKSAELRREAERLGGYDLDRAGDLVWGTQ